MLPLWFKQIAESGLGSKKKGVKSIVMLTVWVIWNARNDYIFNRACSSPEQVFESIREQARTWIRAGNMALQTLTADTNALQR